MRIYRAGPDESEEGGCGSWDGGSGDGSSGSVEIEDIDTSGDRGHRYLFIKRTKVMYETLAYLQYIYDHMLYV